MFRTPDSATLTGERRQTTERCGHGRAVAQPGTLLVVAVVCLASAVGNGLYDDDFSNLATIVFSVLGSLFLAAAIVTASLGHGRTRPGTGRDPAADKAERARRLQEELRGNDRPNLMGNMGGGSGPGTG
jgi:hypothetical protein